MLCVGMFCQAHFMSIVLKAKEIQQTRTREDNSYNIPMCDAFHLSTSVYLLRTSIPSFAHNSAYHLRTFFTPH